MEPLSYVELVETSRWRVTMAYSGVLSIYLLLLERGLSSTRVPVLRVHSMHTSPSRKRDFIGMEMAKLWTNDHKIR